MIISLQKKPQKPKKNPRTIKQSQLRSYENNALTHGLRGCGRCCWFLKAGTCWDQRPPCREAPRCRQRQPQRSLQLSLIPCLWEHGHKSQPRERVQSWPKPRGEAHAPAELTLQVRKTQENPSPPRALTRGRVGDLGFSAGPGFSSLPLQL